MDIYLLQSTIQYITSAPLFWQSMGFTSAMFVFIGGVIYDGRVEEAKKGLITIGAYVSMLIWVTILRVNDRVYNSANYSRLSRENASMAYAGVITIFFITLSCVFGIALGVFIIRYGRRIRDISKSIKLKITNLFK